MDWAGWAGELCLPISCRIRPRFLRGLYGRLIELAPSIQNTWEMLTRLTRLVTPPHSRVERRASRSVWIASTKAIVVLIMVALATALIAVFSETLHTVNIVSIVYLLPVLLAAFLWGTGQATVAAVAGALAADFFFYPPRYSFWISDTQNVADLMVFLIVAFVSGELAAHLRNREYEIRELYRFSQRLASCFTAAELIRASQDYLSEFLGLPVSFIDERAGEDELEGLSLAVWRAGVTTALTDDRAAHTIIDGATRHHWLVLRAALGTLRYLLFIDLGTHSAVVSRRSKRRITAAIADASRTLARLDLPKALEDARIQGQADTLRNALVATMSHDLRAPLVSILGAASVLGEIGTVKADARALSLVATVEGEASRLDGDIQNLLAAASITAGMGRRNPELTDPIDMIRAAVARKGKYLAAHRLDVSLAAELPFVVVQSTLIENAIGQLLDNAAKYSPVGSTITIAGHQDGDWLMLSVSDRGAGLTPPELQQVGQRSFRGTRSADSTGGFGLGLWIANTFIAANGGSLEAESAGPDRGTTFRIRLPIARVSESDN
jgi:K+-sensing histidine kinase KdpD